jgi:hypothetical protein
MRIASHVAFGAILAAMWIWIAGSFDGFGMDCTVVLCSIYVGAYLVVRWPPKSE